MALPIAQLGYMPNINAPSHVPTYQVKNPWEELAMQVLGQVVGNAAGNLMSRDYATQATAENPEQISAGPFMSPETGEVVGSTASTPLGSQNAGFISKMFQGPQMNAQQYGQVQANREQVAGREDTQEFQGQENRADRELRQKEGEAERNTRSNQFNQSIGLDRDRLKLAETGQAADTLFKGGALAVDRQRADSYDRAVSMPKRDNSADNAVIQLATAMREQATKQATLQAVSSGQNPMAALAAVPPIESFIPQAVAAFEQHLAKLGIQQPTMPQVPGVPLVSP